MEKEINKSAPYWDESRKAVFVPVIDKWLDARNLSVHQESWTDAMKLAERVGEALPSQKEMFILLYYRSEINEILEKNGGDILDGWYWSSENCWGDEVWSADFSHGAVGYDNEITKNYVRAISD